MPAPLEKGILFMKSGQNPPLVSTRENLRALLENIPLEPEERDHWLETVLDEALGPFEALRREADGFQEQMRHLQSAVDVLRAENERLRARLAGHRELETAVHERAEAFRTLAENSRDAIVRLDPQLRHIYVNPMFTALTGRSSGDLLGRTLAEIDFYDPVRADLPDFSLPFQTGEEQRGVISFPAQGGWRWYDLRVVPEPGAAGEVETVLVVARDITHLKIAEEARRRSEDRFRVASEAAGMAVFEQDRDLVYTWAYNPHIGGTLPPVGKQDHEIFPPHEAAELTRLKQEVLRSGQGARREMPLTIEGQLRYFDLMLEPLLDAQGRPDGILGAYIEITGRKESERELEYRALLLQNVHDAIVATDANLAVTSWNPAAEALYGWKAEEVLGCPVYEVIPSEISDVELERARTLLGEGKSYRYEMVQYTRDGRRLWVESHGMALFDDAGQVIGYVSSNRDITQRHKLMQENEQQRALLEALFQADPSGIAVVSGPNLVYQMANAAYRVITPHPDVDPLGRSMDEIWPEHEGFNGGNLVRQALEEGASLTFEQVSRRYPDGSLRYFTMHVRPIASMETPSALVSIWETTELQNALEKAEAGQRMLEALLEYIPEGVTISSAPDMRVLYTSKYTAGLGAYEREELQGRSWTDYARLWKMLQADGVTPLAEDDFPAVRAGRNGEIIENGELVLDQDGRHVHLLINAGPIRDAEGRIFASIVTAHDITERKRDEANHRFLGGLSQAMVSMTTPLEVLRGTADLLGSYLDAARCFISEEEEESKRHIVRADYHPGNTSLAGQFLEDHLGAAVIERVRQGKAVIVADLAAHPLTAADFAVVYEPQGMHALVLLPRFDWQNRLQGVLCVTSAKPRTWRADELHLLNAAVDLTRLALESAALFEDLREFRHRLEIALRNTLITIITTDRDLRPTWIFNPRYGYTSEKMLGKLPEEVDPSGILTPIYALARGVLEDGQSVSRELRLDVAGRIFHYNITIEPLHDEQGRISGLTLAAMETTDIRRMEAEAVQNLAQIEVQRRLIAERELERTHIARELHDGPLQDLIGASYRLVEAMEINEKETRITKMRVIQDMLTLQIRELRRFCNELRPPVLAPFGLEKTIRAHAQKLQELYPDLKINVDLQRDGQRLSEETRMTLYRIYQELMNNVLRHAKASQVTVSLKLKKSTVELQVADNGEGFSVPNEWVDLARRGHLGLVGLQERVQMFGGRVEMESTPGKGTRVRVLVPR